MPHKWGVGTIHPRPSQVRVALLEWSPENQELIEVTLTPDLSFLIFCDECRTEFMTDMIASLLRLKEKQPKLVEVEVVH